MTTAKQMQDLKERVERLAKALTNAQALTATRDNQLTVRAAARNKAFNAMEERHADELRRLELRYSCVGALRDRLQKAQERQATLRTLHVAALEKYDAAVASARTQLEELRIALQ